MNLIPVNYLNKKYPFSINPQIDEIAGNFDSKKIRTQRPYSLHTEYSYGVRKLNSALLSDLNEIKSAIIKGVPELWKNEKWANEFAEFVFRITLNNMSPEIIEIHPPFRHYCKDIKEFLSIYKVFELAIKKAMPSTSIFIENRCGTRAGKQFLISNCKDVLSLLKFLNDSNINLKIVIDYPQLFSGEKINMNVIDLNNIITFNKEIVKFRHLVGGFHFWGKKKSSRWVSHIGDLTSLFSGDLSKKKDFLLSVKNTFNDGVARYFVPEVNSSEGDLQSIVKDMISAGFKFI